MPNGVIYYNGVVPGSIAYLSCDEGYSSNEDTVNRTCLTNDTWSEIFRRCVALPSSSASSTLTTGGSIALSIVLTFFVALALGILIALLALLLFKKSCVKSFDPASNSHQMDAVQNEYAGDVKKNDHVVIESSFQDTDTAVTVEVNTMMGGQ